MDRYQLIESYISDLGRRLGAGGQQTRDAVDECRDHLHLAVEALTAGGHPEAEAQAMAIARMGPAGDLARSIRRQLVGRASPRTRVAGMFGLAAGAGLAASLAPALYALTMPGSRPNADDAARISAGLGQLFLVIFLAGLVLRAAPTAHRVALLAAVTVPAAFSVFSVGIYSLAYVFDSPWVVIGLPAIEVVALLATLRPWPTDGFGPVWARAALCTGVLVTGTALLTAPAWAGVVAAFLLAPATMCLGHQLWAERPHPIPSRVRA